ncbi:MAG: hypothetical protein H6Q75_1209 [Firmicutes bacterium]|nr:hypothetical protein [Bacillota bacterium]
MGNICFEKMKEVYLDAVLDIYNHYVLNSTATFHSHPLNKEEMRNLVFFANEKYITFVILQNNTVCGYVLLTRHKAREAYDTTAEVTIYLHPAFVKQGLGGLALSHIEGYAKTQSIHALVATICWDNTASIALFEKHGYAKCAHYKEVGKKFNKYLDLVAYQKIT